MPISSIARTKHSLSRSSIVLLKSVVWHVTAKIVASLLLFLCVLQVAPQTAEAKKSKRVKEPVACCQKDKKCSDTNEKKNDKKMDKITSFTYHQTGGFAGISRGYSIKLADLEKAEAEKLSSLIESSGLLKLKEERKTTPGAADMFFYEFSASNGGEHKATFDDGSLPESFRPLLEFVREKAKVEPRS